MKKTPKSIFQILECWWKYCFLGWFPKEMGLFGHILYIVCALKVHVESFFLKILSVLAKLNYTEKGLEISKVFSISELT